MIDSILGYSLDYVLASYGLLMFIASVEMYRMRRRDVLWHPWKWLSAFAGLQVLHAWGVLASMSLRVGNFYHLIGFFVISLSYFCLFEFGVRSRIGKRGAAWRVITAPILLVILLTVLHDGSGRNTLVILFAMVSSITAAYAMLRRADQAIPESRKLLCFGSVSILLCGVTMCVGMVNPQNIHLAPISSAAFMSHHSWPVEYYQVIGAGLFFLFVMLYAMHCNKNDGRRLGQDCVTPYQIYITISLIPLLGIGWMLCKMGGDFGMHQFRKSLIGRAQTAAATTSPDDVQKLYHLDSPNYSNTLRFFREQMDKVRSVNGDTRFIYLLGRVGPNIVFLADCEDDLSPDYSPPMQIYTEINEPVRAVFLKPEPVFDGPTEDRWGVYVSAFVPIVDRASGGVIAVMGMDVTGHLWLSAVARYRLAAIIAMLMVVVVLVVLGSAYILTKDALVNREMSQGRFQRVFDSAPEGIMIVAIVDGLVKAVNRKVLSWLSVTLKDVVGQPINQCMSVGDEFPDSDQEIHIVDQGLTRCLSVTRAEINFQGHKSYLYFLRDVTLRKQAEESKERLVSELQETNAELQQIIHAVAHDLKAPTRSISTLAQWIKTDYQNSFDDQANVMLDTIIERTYRTDRLLSGLLEFIRIGRVKPVALSVDFKQLVDDVLVQCRIKDRCPVEVNVPDSVTTDPSLVSIILKELVENAASHGYAEGKPVVVTANMDEEQLILSVRDYGAGIDPKYHAKVFGLFETLNPKDETGRLGLGLALVKKVVQRMGGQVRVDNMSEGGSSVTVTVHTG